jgi:hypothetical protein
MVSRQFLWALSPLAAAIVLAGERPAQATLSYYIYQSGPDVILETSGSLNLSSPSANPQRCTDPGGGAIFPLFALFCTGPSQTGLSQYAITGPNTFSGFSNITTNSTFGTPTALDGGSGRFSIDSGYLSGPIISSATFNSQTLSDLGFTTPGLLGTWTLSSTGDTIQVIVGNPPAPVPGPLPLLGAGAAFGFSRRLRRRVSLSRAASQPATSISA